MRKKIAVFSTGYCANILMQFMSGLKKGFEAYPVDTHLFIAFPTYFDTAGYIRGEFNIFNLPDLSKYDGAVLFANSLDQPGVAEGLVKRCGEAGIPVICHGKMLDGAYNIVSDNRSAMCELTEYLVSEKNVKSVCFISGTKDSYDASERLEAIKAVLENHGIKLPDDNISYTDWNVNKARDYAAGLIDEGRVPDAIICANDDLAITVCILLKEKNIRVPEDVIVTGFDHVPESETFYPSLATVDQQFEENGIFAARMMYDLCEGREKERLTSLDCRFIMGESCGGKENEHLIAVRRNFCIDSYVKRNRDTKLNEYTLKLERAVLSSSSYTEMKEKLKAIMVKEHDFEGNTFHFFIDPKAFTSIADNQNNLVTFGYSKEMDVIISMQDNVLCEIEKFCTDDLLPAVDDPVNHMYVFTPLHDDEYSTGYLVFCDCYESIGNRVVHTCQQRLDVAIEKFRQNLYLQYLNDRVLEVSRVDQLTHVKNRLAFESRVEEIMTRISSDPGYRFAIAMFDVNNLKGINDNYGHEAGDEYILGSSRLICSFFKHSPVYRVGGDEFIAVLEEEDYTNLKENLSAFRSRLESIWNTETIPEKRISVASGIAKYDPSVHRNVEDVYKDADAEMYENKKAMKKKNHLGKIR